MNPMETHVKVLGVLQIICGALGVLIGVGIFLVLGGTAGLVQMDGDPDAAMVVPLLGSIGFIVLIFFLVLSVPGIVAGVGLLSYRSWARILSLVLSVLSLINIPIGTAIGAYGLWVLLSKDGSALFEQRSAEPSTPY